MPITEYDPLRLVLFGLPRAGKTSLLAALAQVQEAQPTLIPGKIEDPSGGLTRLRQVQYEQQPRGENETVSYPARLPAQSGPVDVLLVDGNGQVTLDVLKKRAALDQVQGEFPHEVLEADTLLVIADATLKAETYDKVLTALDDFLRRHEQVRGRRSDVVGLPVFLVLTHCDHLAQEGDTVGDWMRRVEEQKRQVRKRMQDFLDASDRPHSFGRLVVHVWATATGRPALGSTPARPREPYGVAELFGQALTEGMSYRRREDRADRRLSRTVTGVGGVAGVLAILTGALVAGLGRQEPNELQRRIDRYQALEGKDLADRLHDYPPDLVRRLDDLKEIRADEGFPRLSDDSRGYVKLRIDELGKYIDYLEEVLTPRFSTPARSEEELDDREKILREQLPLPDLTWSVTGAGKLRQQLLDDIGRLRDYSTRAVRVYQQLYSEGVKLREFQVPEPEGRNIRWREWQKEVEEYARRVQDPPFNFDELPPHSLVTPQTILQLDSVRQARDSILGSEDDPAAGGLLRDLSDIRDIATALGLVPATPERPALLVVPRAADGDTPKLPPVAARQRWRSLERHPELAASLVGLAADPAPTRILAIGTAYPRENPLVPPYFWFHSAFALSHVPPAARESVSGRARQNRDDLLQLLAEQWKKPMEEISKTHPAETLDFWRELARRLQAEADESQSYRRLAQVLDRLTRLNAAEPVAELVAFIDRPAYVLNVKNVFVTIPLDAEVAVGDQAELTIRCGTREHRFRLDPDRTRREDAPLRKVYTFTGPARLEFRPGEDCEARLPCRGENVLTWWGQPRRPFAFLALAAWPRLHDSDRSPGRGRTARKVELQFDADAALPSPPPLLGELVKVLQSAQPAP